MIVFVGIFAWAVYTLILRTIERTPRDHDENRARQILDQRLARGEIDAEEYRKLQNLMAADSHRSPIRAIVHDDSPPRGAGSPMIATILTWPFENSGSEDRKPSNGQPAEPLTWVRLI